MEYNKKKKIVRQCTKLTIQFRIKKWVKIIDGTHRTYSNNSQNKFKTSMLKSSVCSFSDAYILVKGAITVSNMAVAAVAPNSDDK